jgi:hypothetical protein
MRLRSDQGLWLGTSATMIRFALAVEVLIYVARGSSPLTSTILATNTLALFGPTTPHHHVTQGPVTCDAQRISLDPQEVGVPLARVSFAGEVTMDFL